MKLWGKKGTSMGGVLALAIALAACAGTSPLSPESDGIGDELGPVSSTGLEFEGVVVAVDPSNRTFTLDDGTVVHVSDDGAIEVDGDFDTLEALADALEAGATVRVEGRLSDDGVLEATLVEFETAGEADDEADDEAEDVADDEAEDDDADDEEDDVDDETEDEEDDVDDEADNEDEEDDVDDEDDADDEDEDDAADADDGDENEDEGDEGEGE
jgi:hypothetical protein